MNLKEKETLEQSYYAARIRSTLNFREMVNMEGPVPDDNLDNIQEITDAVYKELGISRQAKPVPPKKGDPGCSSKTGQKGKKEQVPTTSTSGALVHKTPLPKPTRPPHNSDAKSAKRRESMREQILMQTAAEKHNVSFEMARKSREMKELPVGDEKDQRVRDLVREYWEADHKVTVAEVMALEKLKGSSSISIERMYGSVLKERHRLEDQMKKTLKNLNDNVKACRIQKEKEKREKEREEQKEKKDREHQKMESDKEDGKVAKEVGVNKDLTGKNGEVQDDGKEDKDKEEQKVLEKDDEVKESEEEKEAPTATQVEKDEKEEQGAVKETEMNGDGKEDQEGRLDGKELAIQDEQVIKK